MGRKFNQIAMSWPVFILSLLGFFSYGVASLWPASYWLEVRSIKVSDGKWPPVLAVDRTIRRDFYGRYNVAVYRFDGGGWVAVCTAEKARIYRAGARLPEVLTLEWWTEGGDCDAAKLDKPGRYNMSTQWTIDGGTWLPDKEVSVISNIWSVSNE